MHHGIDPAAVPFLRGWLRAVEFVASRLRGVPPFVLTGAGGLFAVASLIVARQRPWLALLLVIIATSCDALDGTVAALAGKASTFGARADKTADRIADSCFALVIWRCGAPLWLAVLAGTMSLAHEGLREAHGGVWRARITVAERPTRVICALLACVCAGIAHTVWAPTVCAGVWVALAAVGLAQLVRT